MRLPDAREETAPSWLVWAALWTVYIVWGSTYLAIRVTVETMPPLLAASARFFVAGGLLASFLLIKKGRGALRISRAEVGGAALVGTLLLLGGNGIVMVAEQDVPSGLASLLIASTPLWVVLLRFIAKERISTGTLLGVATGFVGVALLVMPGDKPEGAPILGMLFIVLAAFLWGTGSFLSKRVPLPKDPFVSTAMQMLLGGVSLAIAGLVLGEGSRIHFEEFSTRSIVALSYLVVFGSLVAFTAYVWVLQHAPISKVATYAFVNPVIAIFLGWLLLNEEVTPWILAGAGVIVASVAFIVRKESTPALTDDTPDDIAESSTAAFATADA
jgi:drug/metabolite transporter (DMT)-like permease